MIVATDTITAIAVLTPSLGVVVAVLRYVTRLILAINGLVEAIRKHGKTLEHHEGTLENLTQQIFEHEEKDLQVQREITDRLALTGATLLEASEKLSNGKDDQ